MQATAPDSFSYLKLLFSRLGKEEIRYLKTFVKGNGFDDSKMYSLLEIMLDKPELAEGSVSGLLYGKSGSVAFDKLVCRLRDRIHEGLMMDVNLFREDAYSDVYMNWFWVKKQIPLSQVLLGKGLGKEVQVLYERIIKVCKDYELYHELVEVLRLKQFYVGLRFGSKSYKKLLSEITFYEGCRAARFHAQHAYHMLITGQDFKADNLSGDMIGYLEETLAEIRQSQIDTRSNYVLYYQLLLEMDLHQKKGNIPGAIKAGKDLIRLLKNNPSVYIKRNLANVHLNQGYNFLSAYDFAKALKEARAASQLYSENTINYGLPMELEFYSYLYMDETTKAIEIMERLVGDPVLNPSPFHLSKRKFLLAIALYIGGYKVEKVEKLLLECEEIENDKEGWNPMIRLFLIQIHIIRGKLDPASTEIENLSKYVQRLKADKGGSPRLSLIVKVLNRLVKNGFSFRLLYNNHPQMIKELSALNGEASWKIFSSEPLMFHKWLESMKDQKVIAFTSFFQKKPQVKEMAE